MRGYTVNLDNQDLNYIMVALDNLEDLLTERIEPDRRAQVAELNLRLGRARARQDELKEIL
jgi:hypothetical protein